MNPTEHNQDSQDAAHRPIIGGIRVEAIIGLAVLVLLIIGCSLVLLPFISALLWAAILCFSTWGLYGRLRDLLGGRGSLAALVMTLLLATIAVMPFVIVGNSLAGNVSDVVSAIRHTIEQGPQEPPAWVRQLPLVGPQIEDRLIRLAHDSAARREQVKELIVPLRTFGVELGKALGRGVLEISLSLLICFFFYRDGDNVTARLNRAVFRVGGERGRHLLEVASLTVRGVVEGVIGTSLAQGVLAGVGFWIAGVPGALLLGFATFLLAFIPMGPVLLWLPAAIWLFTEGATRWAVFLLIWSIVVVGGSENVLKPILIGRSGTAPLIIVMLGVVGGALAFGFIGVFIGPTLLAVGYSLIDEWSGGLT
ncbi:MAG: AI-2E family transporter [Candidatus Binataceae bacterium]